MSSELFDNLMIEIVNTFKAKNCDLDLSVEWFRSIKLTAVCVT